MPTTAIDTILRNCIGISRDRFTLNLIEGRQEN